MADYTIDASDPSRPLDTDQARYAAAELRAIKLLLSDTITIVNELRDTLNNGDIGVIKAWAGTTIPDDHIQLPTSATNVSRTTYATLFAAIGTTWGVGDSVTTFGLPYVPVDSTVINASASGAVTAGIVGNHTHVYLDAYYTESGATGTALSEIIDTGVSNLYGSHSSDTDNRYLYARSAETNNPVANSSNNVPAAAKVIFIMRYR